jgi:hypothetical protein
MGESKANNDYTSNFAKSAKHPDAVAISQGVPRFYRGKRYMRLTPPRWLLKAKDPELFDREYRKQLDSLDAKQVAEELGPRRHSALLGAIQRAVSSAAGGRVA